MLVVPSPCGAGADRERRCAVLARPRARSAARRRLASARAASAASKVAARGSVAVAAEVVVAAAARLASAAVGEAAGAAGMVHAATGGAGSVGASGKAGADDREAPSLWLGTLAADAAATAARPEDRSLAADRPAAVPDARVCVAIAEPPVWCADCRPTRLLVWPVGAAMGGSRTNASLREGARQKKGRCSDAGATIAPESKLADSPREGGLRGGVAAASPSVARKACWAARDARARRPSCRTARSRAAAVAAAEEALRAE